MILITTLIRTLSTRTPTVARGGRAKAGVGIVGAGAREERVGPVAHGPRTTGDTGPQTLKTEPQHPEEEPQPPTHPPQPRDAPTPITSPTRKNPSLVTVSLSTKDDDDHPTH
ncbi:Zinc finger protein ubi-d4 [Caligus rogercresseyi]|uniref:Zinc finger protein ubi-d4 n=1 Tax=Caligus rogercresseyi TaxID=217165 RepID=A0A7T8KMD8_CALRO|nr:Zinc finger protein ubi-d4 [Caligus rogercresseyi]